VSPATTTIVTAFAVASVLTIQTFLPYAELDRGNVIVTPADAAFTRTIIGVNSKDVAVVTFRNSISAGTARGRVLYESKFCSIVTELCAGSIPDGRINTPSFAAGALGGVVGDGIGIICASVFRIQSYEVILQTT
jgi:hypothetical protein